MFTELVAELERVECATLDRAGAEAALGTSAQVRRWLDGLDVRLAACVSSCAERDPASVPAEDSIAAATRTTTRDARRIVRRAHAAAEVPLLRPGLAAGEVSGEHLDVVQQAVARLDATRRHRFCDAYGSQIAREAARVTSDELRTSVARWLREFDSSDGVDRLVAQRRQVGMREWWDRASGMWRFSGQLDPETGFVVSARLHSTVDALFRERVPSECPDDPDAKQSFLRAHALVALTTEPVRAGEAGEGPEASAPATPRPVANGSAERMGVPTCSCGSRRDIVRWRTDAVVVIDERTLRDGWHDRSHVDLGAGVDLPLQTVRRLVAESRIVPVLRGGDGVVARVGGRAAAPLDLGRASRLASWAQRHALRVMHPTCGVPGCDIAFERCQPHHVVWWEHGGATDLRNLLPLCSRHHHLVHDAGWHLHLARDRTVTVTRPDGRRVVGHLVRRWPR